VTRIVPASHFLGNWHYEGSAMRTKLWTAVIGIGLSVSPIGVYAHHAFAAEFDAEKPVTLSGTVTQVDWVNPHIWIHMDVKDPSGKVINWMVEGGAPNAMFRRGWNKESIVAGTQVTVDGYRAKNGSNKANGKDVLLPDGRKLFVGSSGTGAPYDVPKK
jgi:uncharacterized protein DUF6152